MKFENMASKKQMLVPESIDECGVLMWLSKRYENKKVEILFDTTNIHGVPSYPCLWIKEEGEVE